MPDTWVKHSLAEFVGTFIFFSIGIGAIIAGGQLLEVALAHGIILAVVVSAFMRISGGKFNPAVSIGVWTSGKQGWQITVVEIVAQLLGGILAGAVLALVFNVAQVQGGTPAIATAAFSGSNLVPVAGAVVLEALLTFFLVTAVLLTAVDGKAPAIAGFGIGLTVFVGILVAGPFTGAAMNPARFLGPGIVAGFYDNWWVYMVGPIAGGIVAALLYRYVFDSDLDEATA